MKKQMSAFNIKSYLATAIVAAMFLLFFSAYTSPLFPEYIDYDSGIFMMVGKAIISGKQLYVDVFDHKGPILFWIEALGMLFDRYGLFVIQTVFLTIDLVLCRKISTFFIEDEDGNKCKLWLCQGFFLIFLAYPLANGNLCEEYSLPLIFGCLYFFLCDFKEGRPKIRHSFYYGFFIGVFAFVRINNAITVFAVVLVWIVILLKQRKIKELLSNIVAGLIGIVCIGCPIILYFYLDGSLSEMLYATFIFNMKYSRNMEIGLFLSYFPNVVRMIILFVPLCGSILVLVYKRWRVLNNVWWALLIIVVANMLTFVMGHGYNHYFTIAVPIEVIMLAIVLNNCNISKVVCVFWYGIVCIYAVLALRVVYRNINDYYLESWVLKQRIEVEGILSEIPKSDSQEVLGFDVPAKYYLYGDFLPCFKYGILQSNWSISDSAVMKEYLVYLKEGKATWLMVDANADNVEVINVINDSYEMVSENDYLKLYKKSLVNE